MSRVSLWSLGVTMTSYGAGRSPTLRALLSNSLRGWSTDAALPGGQVAFAAQQFGGEHRPAGGAAHRVVRQRDEPPVEDRVGSQPADRDRLAAARVAIEPGLRPGLVLEVMEE